MDFSAFKEYLGQGGDEVFGFSSEFFQVIVLSIISTQFMNSIKFSFDAVSAYGQVFRTSGNSDQYSQTIIIIIIVRSTGQQDAFLFSPTFIPDVQAKSIKAKQRKAWHNEANRQNLSQFQTRDGKYLRGRGMQLYTSLCRLWERVMMICVL